MANVFPFRPFRYTPKAGPASDLVTQPYDKIPADLQEQYYAASPYNIIRVIKGRPEPGDNESNNVYTRAARTFERWAADGIVAQDPSPGFYPYFQEFEHPDTKERLVRKGLIGLFELAEYQAGTIHRHELTHSGPKVDRLKLARETRGYFEQLFVLYDDAGFAVESFLDEAARAEPLLTAREQGVVHRLWKISDPTKVHAIQEAMAPRKLMIADGHHRYETALNFFRENRDLAGADRVMMTLVNLRSSGLVVLATHRVLGGLSGFDSETLLRRAGELFDIEAVASDRALQVRLDSAAENVSLLGGIFQGDPKAYLFAPKQGALAALLSNSTPQERTLDVVILHRALFGKAMGISEEDVRDEKNIQYVRGFQAAVEQVRRGGAQAAFLLRPVAAARVAEIAFAGGVMPQKSTDFYPKLLSGIAMYRFG
jgi:uncharacterized protein (DUF1015 family)